MPCTCAGVMVRPSRVVFTPAPWRAAASALSAAVDRSPSPPATSKAFARVLAHLVSLILASMYVWKAFHTLVAFSEPHPQPAWKATSAALRPTKMVMSSLFLVVVLEAKVRSLSGRAEDVPPEAVDPVEGLERVWRVGAAGAWGAGVPVVEVGRWSRFHRSSQPFSTAHFSARRASHSRAFLRCAFSALAESTRNWTALATPRRQVVRFLASVVSMAALSEKTWEK